jgi:predicted DNA-binding helix-hairpin-helix protein
MIVQARRFGKLTSTNLKKIGVVLKRAMYFITCRELPGLSVQELKPEIVKRKILQKETTSQRKREKEVSQLKLFC